MTLISPTALEAAAKHIDPEAFAKDQHGYLMVRGESRRKRAKQTTTAAITAYLAQMEKEGWVMVPAFHLSNLRAADKRIKSVKNRGSDTAEQLIQIECLLAWPSVQGMLAAAQNGGE